jgi:hypothetical protein
LTPDPYARLVELAERELALATQDDIDELLRVAAEREALIATLPDRAPESAHPALIDAARFQAQTTAILTAARARVSAEMGDMERGRQTAAGYGRASGTAPRQSTITVAA